MSGVDSPAPLRVVQVGAGAMGRHWIDVIGGTPEVQLVGLVDLDADLARSAVPAGSDAVTGTVLADVVAETGADAVIDVTVPPAHHAVNTEALLLGLPVLCEKPIAASIAETLSLIAASDLTGRLLMTSQSRRYYPALAEFRALGAALGGAGVLTTEFFKAPRFGGFRDEMDQPLLLDMAIHPFDAARYVLGSEPIRVDCRTWNPGWSWYRGDAAASAMFDFEGGVRYVYTGSWCSPGLETSWNGRWRLSAAGGSAIWDGEGRPESEALEPTAASGVSPSASARSEVAGALDDFVDAVRTGRTPEGAVRSNIRSLAMVEAAVRSSAESRPVELADVLADGYRAAIADETRDDVRAILESWGSAEAGLVTPPAD